MRRIRKPKLFDFESDESINLYDTFQSAYKEMTALSLSPADISKLVHTKHLSDILHVPITEIAALVVIVNRHEIKNMVSEVEASASDHSAHCNSRCRRHSAGN